MRLHAGELELGIGLKKSKVRHRPVGIEHFAVDAILIERFQSFGGIVNDLRDFVPTARIVAACHAAFHRRWTIAHPLAAHFAVDHPAVDRLAVLVDLDDLRDPLAPLLLGHALGPSILVKLCMRIAAK